MVNIGHSEEYLEYHNYVDSMSTGTAINEFIKNRHRSSNLIK